MSQTEKKADQSLLIWGSFFILTLFWGSSFILIKKALLGFSAFQVADIRLFTAGATLASLAYVHVKRIPREKLKYVFVVSITGIFLPAYLFSAAQLGLNSSVVGVLNALTPAFTFLISLFFFGGKRNNMQLLGLMLGFFGSILLIAVNAKGQFSLNNYAFFVVAATICYGTNTNLVKNYLSDVPALYISTVSVTIAGLLTLPHLFLSGTWGTHNLNLEGISKAFSGDWKNLVFEKWQVPMFAAMSLGLLGTALAQLIFNRVLQLSSAVFASSITYFIPIVAVMWGIFDGEVLLIWHYVGMLFIIIGIFILNKNR
ncbi:MAG: hypothetical protein RL757_3316 [Bacteroidota bacterium]|jgi:drug/metabolite transporter (DMT)-like permease